MEDVSLDLYRVYYTVVKEGGMSKAAARLYISQPAVSMAIAKLEKNWGRPLLHRTKGRIWPTPEGQALYRHLEKAFAEIEKGEALFRRMNSLEEGLVRIGASDTLCSQYLLPYLETYHSRYPEIRLQVTNRTSGETIGLLRAGEVDIGFINLPVEDAEGLVVTPCLTVHDCLVASHKWAHLRRGAHLENLWQYPLIMLERQSATRRYLDEYAAGHGIKLKPAIQLGSSDLLIQFAKIKLGLSFVIREFAKEHIDDVHLFEIPLSPVIMPRQVGLVRRREMPMSVAVSRLLEVMGIAAL